MSFESNSIDIILTMETIEHVNPHEMLKECARVLKKDGYIILSTPQNSMKEKCINPHHLYEYSLDELTKLVSQYFYIEKTLGLKAGRIYFDNDPIGANSVLFAKKLQ
jgi:2-polyprenyl-3-methyl-5-hydroxy-6-metoxy-1,4-benzoquinol methylase